MIHGEESSPVTGDLQATWRTDDERIHGQTRLRKLESGLTKEAHQPRGGRRLPLTSAQPHDRPIRLVHLALVTRRNATDVALKLHGADDSRCDLVVPAGIEPATFRV